MNFNSLYARLRVTASATSKEIKIAYYRLSKLYHPDRSGNCPKATIQFRNITEAYEVLSDPKSKAEYDEEFFPKQRFSATNRFRTSLRGRRFQVPPDNYFEEIDSTVKERMKQYRGQNESSEK